MLVFHREVDGAVDRVSIEVVGSKTRENPHEPQRVVTDIVGREPHPASELVARYLAGERVEFFRFEGEAFPPLENKFRGQFSRRAFEVLKRVPYGTTITYGQLARLAGSEAARAAGNVARQNPYPVLVPCHRVVAAKGMGGFAGRRHGAWLRVKATLLDLERGATF